MQENMRNITPEEIHQFMQQDADVQLVDVRSSDEFSNHHVSGASNVPMDRLNSCAVAEQHGEQAGREVPLFVMCASGKRSEAAAEKLMQQGLHNIAVVDGGTQAWSKAGLPLKGNKRLPGVEQQAQIFMGVIILLALIKASLISPWFYVLTGVVGAALIFSGMTACNRLPMMLARLPWNRQSSSA